MVITSLIFQKEFWEIVKTRGLALLFKTVKQYLKTKWENML